ncbi:hypothetical protein [Streptomyces sp. NPDC093514]|uniref:ATP-dependent DNA ligase n=1 Tax=Streptomyces sp. NPDC093514 TaxID=3366039 RepID=UPI0038075C74
MLRPPVEPVLAQAAEAVPPPAGPGGTVLVQTRRGALVQDRWPDLVAAAEAQSPHGLVLDGEPVVWDSGAGRLSFEALQRRAATRARGARTLAARWPAYFAFDLLQQDGKELLTRPYAERRALLEDLIRGRPAARPSGRGRHGTPCQGRLGLAHRLPLGSAGQRVARSCASRVGQVRPVCLRGLSAAIRGSVRPFNRRGSDQLCLVSRRPRRRASRPRASSRRPLAA